MWEKDGIPTPMTTKKPVMKRPSSTTALLPPSMKSSEDWAREQIQLGTGAIT